MFTMSRYVAVCLVAIDNAYQRAMRVASVPFVEWHPFAANVHQAAFAANVYTRFAVVLPCYGDRHGRRAFSL